MPVNEWLAGLLLSMPSLTLQDVTVNLNIVQLQALSQALNRLSKREQEARGRMGKRDY